MAEFVARDELRFFESYFLQLARELGQKGQTIGTGELGFIESRHYRRLVRTGVKLLIFIFAWELAPLIQTLSVM